MAFKGVCVGNDKVYIWLVKSEENFLFAVFLQSLVFFFFFIEWVSP